MKLFIHIGTINTEAMLFQQYCYFNNIALKADGLWFPDPEIAPLFKAKKHSFLAQLLVEGEDKLLENYFEDAFNEAQNNKCHSVVITVENFNTLSLENLLKFKQLLPKAIDVHIIATFRNIYDYVIDSLAERFIHQNQFLQDDGIATSYAALLDYKAIIEKYETAFGEPNVTVLPFDQNKKEMTDVYFDCIGHSSINSTYLSTVYQGKTKGPDFASIVLWSLLGLIQSPKDYRHMKKDFLKSFSGIRQKTSPVSAYLMDQLVQAIPYNIDHKKLIPFKDALTQKPIAEELSEDDRVAYMKAYSAFLSIHKNPKYTFLQRLKLVFPRLYKIF